MKRFILTENHLKLIQHMHVSWWNCEFGAPCIDPKRPYGDSAVLLSIAEILGLNKAMKIECDGNIYDVSDKIDLYELPDELEKKLRDLHKETQTALQICIRTQSFITGIYECDNYDSNWRRIDNAS